MAVSISLGDNSLLVVEQQVNNAKSLVTKEYVDTKTTFAEAVWAPSFNATSSEAVKKDIKSFKKSALNIVKKVNIVL
jgi:hypothetical protein